MRFTSSTVLNRSSRITLISSSFSSTKTLTSASGFDDDLLISVEGSEYISASTWTLSNSVVGDEFSTVSAYTLFNSVEGDELTAVNASVAGVDVRTIEACSVSWVLAGVNDISVDMWLAPASTTSCGLGDALIEI